MYICIENQVRIFLRKHNSKLFNLVVSKAWNWGIDGEYPVRTKRICAVSQSDDKV